MAAASGGRTGRTAAGSPSFFESMDGLWEIELGPDALQGPVGPYGVFLFVSYCFCGMFGNFKLMISSRSWFMIWQIMLHMCELISKKV